MLRFGRRSERAELLDRGNLDDRYVEERYVHDTAPGAVVTDTTLPGTTIVRHEKDPMSGWIMAFMVMVVLVGLGFMSLMDLSSQQAKTERALFQLQQEVQTNIAAAQADSSDYSRERIYSSLNTDGSVNGMLADKTTDPNDTSVKQDELAAPFPIVPNSIIEKAETPVPGVK